MLTSSNYLCQVRSRESYQEDSGLFQRLKVRCYSFSINDLSRRYGFSILGIEAASESLGKHHPGCPVYVRQYQQFGRGDLGFLCFVWDCRNRPDCSDCRICMEVAQPGRGCKNGDERAFERVIDLHARGEGGSSTLPLPAQPIGNARRMDLKKQNNTSQGENRMNANMFLNQIEQIGVGLALIIFPLLFVFAFAVHPGLLRPRLLGPEGLVGRAHKNRLLQFGHVLVTLNTGLLIVVALHFMKLLDHSSGAWAGFTGAAVAILGAIFLAADKGVSKRDISTQNRN